MRILFIDTVSKKQAIHLAVFYDGNVFLERKEIVAPRKQAETMGIVLSLLFSERKIQKLGSLQVILVVVGPGSFSSVREGVVVANALAFAWNIPVVPVFKDDVIRLLRKGALDQYAARAKRGEWVEPVYEKDPNISQPKSPWG